jgi:outer membrane lipoprotein-sorting protein
MIEKLATLIAQWKAALASIAAILVIILQIIQVITAGEIGGALEQKTAAIQSNAAAIQQNTTKLNSLVEQNRAALTALHDELHAIDDAEKAKR